MQADRGGSWVVCRVFKKRNYEDRFSCPTICIDHGPGSAPAQDDDRTPAAIGGSSLSVDGSSASDQRDAPDRESWRNASMITRRESAAGSRSICTRRNAADIHLPPIVEPQIIPAVMHSPRTDNNHGEICRPMSSAKICAARIDSPACKQETVEESDRRYVASRSRNILPSLLRVESAQSAAAASSILLQLPQLMESPSKTMSCCSSLTYSNCTSDHYSGADHNAMDHHAAAAARSSAAALGANCMNPIRIKGAQAIVGPAHDPMDLCCAQSESSPTANNHVTDHHQELIAATDPDPDPDDDDDGDDADDDADDDQADLSDHTITDHNSMISASSSQTLIAEQYCAASWNVYDAIARSYNLNHGMIGDQAAAGGGGSSNNPGFSTINIDHPAAPSLINHASLQQLVAAGGRSSLQHLIPANSNNLDSYMIPSSSCTEIELWSFPR
jgi:hypothetical protein